MSDSSATFLDILDARRLVDESRLRLGKFRARGVPAVLIGVAAIVFASKFGDALRHAATALPETLRETRNVMLLTRGARELPRSN